MSIVEDQGMSEWFGLGIVGAVVLDHCEQLFVDVGSSSKI